MDDFDTNEETKNENFNDAKVFANEFLSEAKKSEDYNNQKGETENEKSKEEDELLKGIELSEIFNLLPPDFIQSLVSPTSFILKQKYSKTFDENTQKEIELIINDSDSILAIKRKCLNKILDNYCEAKGISPDKIKISPIWIYLAFEFFTFKQKIDALEGLKKEMLILKGEAKL